MKLWEQANIIPDTGQPLVLLPAITKQDYYMGVLLQEQLKTLLLGDDAMRKRCFEQCKKISQEIVDVMEGE